MFDESHRRTRQMSWFRGHLRTCEESSSPISRQEKRRSNAILSKPPKEYWRVSHCRIKRNSRKQKTTQRSHRLNWEPERSQFICIHNPATWIPAYTRILGRGRGPKTGSKSQCWEFRQRTPHKPNIIWKASTNPSKGSRCRRTDKSRWRRDHSRLWQVKPDIHSLEV